MSFRLVISMLVVAVVVAACGGDDDATETSTSLPVIDTTGTSAPAAAGNGDDVVDVGETVRVDYIGTLDDGEQFDSSFDRGEQLEFVAGTGQMIAGFDDAVVGMTVGETETVTIPAVDAYGERDEAAIVEFPLEEVPEEFRVEGTQVDLGNGLPATVVEVTDDVVRVDTNHPLAGEALTFEITVVEIVG